MSTRFRGLPPRVLLNLRDNRGSRIPTISRTVSTSDRTGVDVSPFDDTKTLIFSGGVTPASGQQLPIAESLYIWRELIINDRHDVLFNLAEATASLYPIQRTGSDIEGDNPWDSGRVVKGIADHFLEQPDTIPPYRPYVEDNQFEQSQTSDFYLTGTDASVAGIGFNSSLASKTQIRLKLRQKQKYTLLAQTASIAYYNYASGGFGRVGTVTNPSDAFAIAQDQVVSPGIPNSNDDAVNYAHDSRLFSPFGYSIISGTTAVGNPYINAPSRLLGTVFSGSIFNAGVTPVTVLNVGNIGSVTVNPLFAAADDEKIVLSEIQQPFLLEKAVIELPLSASAGWLRDKTRIIGIDPFAQASGLDCGGPCITVGLLNELTPTRRDIILSGTIIPEGDNVIERFTSGSFFLTPQGFRAYGKPSAVVTGSTSFRGRVKFESHAAISNGIFSALPAETLAFGGTEFFEASRIQMINAFGRACDGVTTGRSYFGKEYSIPGLDVYNIRDRVPGTSNSAFHWTHVTPSPYIILPGDKLILSISKHRAAVRNPGDTDPVVGGNRMLLTASHDVAVDVGDINITLYGSLIRDREEFHFGRNEPLTTNAVSEALSFSNVVLDQFDIATRALFSGSYVDDFVSGIMEPSSDNSGPDLGTSFRQVRGSSVAGETSYPMNRFVKLTSFSELYFDSFGPDPREVQIIDGADVAVFNVGDNDRILMYPLRHDASKQTIDQEVSGTTLTENNKWPHAYPFEPRYGGLQRLSFAPSKSGQSTKRYVYGSAFADIIQDVVVTQPSDAIVRVRSDHSPLLPPLGIGTSSIEHLQNTQPNAPGAFYGRRLDTGIFNQGFYSFGDEIANQPKYGVRSTTAFTIDLGPGVVKYKHTFHRGKVHIRGWKYGLYDGNPRATSLVMRRDRFGQFRDMLEQRPFTRFVVRGARRTLGPVRIRFTSAEPGDTESSNLSTAATSSLPYFDGEARNRDELPSNEIVQVSIPTLTSLTP